ncbi:tripartite tricarboxylate transporter substrate binding protein [Achromobacter sp. GG226]|uniref:Bug family tripartite tricarboxylate transporter substrate binding protein n=1 Tax=Verticiella alkaliphila TaxID=2779529 RepID=UPI001C0C1F07|nr:tripartite tricarboxylate transporter substrate binding protein [Verticiella sp. GG226]MBU4610461.1 tripartite tricarboxylate transporter substrate binding protein [Verticiella sp. GG226]
MARCTLAGLTLACTLVAASASAADFPRQPIQLVVGYGPGGGTDMCARALGQHVAEALGHSVVIENRPGAGSSLSIAYVARQNADGHTLATFSTGALMNQLLPVETGYDVSTDLTAIAQVAQYQMGLLVRADSPFQRIEDVIAAAKADPQAISYSTAGPGTPQHLTMERLGRMADVRWTHVPYKSGPETILALMRGDVQVMSQTAEWVPYVRDGRLRLLATYGDARMDGFEAAPTLREAGYDLVAPSILGVVGPRDLPPGVVSTLAAAFEGGMRTPQFAQCADQFGLKPDFKGPEAFKTHLADTLQTWAPVVRDIGLN